MLRQQFKGAKCPSNQAEADILRRRAHKRSRHNARDHRDDSDKRVERAEPALAREMPAAQLLAYPMEIGSKFSLSAHHSYSAFVPQFTARTSGQSRQETFLPFSIASGRMCIDPVR